MMQEEKLIYKMINLQTRWCWNSTSTQLVQDGDMQQSAARVTERKVTRQMVSMEGYESSRANMRSPSGASYGRLIYWNNKTVIMLE